MKRNNCTNCNHCYAIYRKNAFNLWKTHFRYCNKTETIIKPENICEHWQRKQKSEYDLTPERFEQAENDIKYLMDALGDL